MSEIVSDEASRPGVRTFEWNGYHIEQTSLNHIALSELFQVIKNPEDEQVFLEDVSILTMNSGGYFLLKTRNRDRFIHILEILKKENLGRRCGHVEIKGEYFLVLDISPSALRALRFNIEVSAILSAQEKEGDSLNEFNRMLVAAM